MKQSFSLLLFEDTDRPAKDFLSALATACGTRTGVRVVWFKEPPPGGQTKEGTPLRMPEGARPTIVEVGKGPMTRSQGSATWWQSDFAGAIVDVYFKKGGREESEPRRIRAAETLRREIDRIITFEPGANILVMGDFNDDPDNVSLTGFLKAGKFDCEDDPGENNLFNLSFDAYNSGLGTYMYKGNWNMLDQIIASSEMIDPAGFTYVCGSYQVLKPDEIITQEGRFKGAAIPTYGGGNYLAGFSDHFPVGAKFVYTGR